MLKMLIGLGLIFSAASANAKTVFFSLRNEGGFHASLTVSALPQDVVIYKGPNIPVTQRDGAFIDIDDSISQFKMHINVIAGVPCEKTVTLNKEGQAALLTITGTNLSNECTVEIGNNYYRPPTMPL